MAVIVVIGHRRGHAVAFAAHPRFHSHIFEDAVPLVAVEAIPPTRIVLDELGLARAVGEKDVQQTVAVVIEHGYPAHHGLDLVLLGGGAIVEHEIDPGVCCDVFEGDRLDGWSAGEQADQSSEQKSGAQSDWSQFHFTFVQDCSSSRSARMWFTSKSWNSCFWPLGQRISSESIRCCRPSPKCCR